MEGLRVVLVVLGILVVALVYWHTRRQQARRREAAADAQRREPRLGAVGEAAAHVDAGDDATVDGGAADTERIVETEARSGVSVAVPEPGDLAPAADAGPTDGEDGEGGREPAPGVEAPPAAQKIITLRLVAPDDATFKGEDVVLSLRGLGMRHGRYGIFHRYEGADEDAIVFSAASLLEPGSFDLANIREQALPGISMFMVLPGPKDGTEAFDEMMATARTLARSLDADVLDEDGSTLSIQRERYMREEIIEYQHARAAP